MSKYKAGDKVTIELSISEANKLSEGYIVGVSESDIIAHEPAPEPVVRYGFVYGGAYFIGWYRTREEAKTRAEPYEDVEGFIKITRTDNNFTVEKCDE